MPSRDASSRTAASTCACAPSTAAGSQLGVLVVQPTPEYAGDPCGTGSHPGGGITSAPDACGGDDAAVAGSSGTCGQEMSLQAPLESIYGAQVIYTRVMTELTRAIGRPHWLLRPLSR